METVTEQSIVRASSVSAEQVARYRDDGYVLLRGLVGESDAKALANEVMGIMAEIGLGVSKLKQTSRYLAGGYIDALVNSQALLAIASQLMDGPSSLYMPFTAVKSGGGGGMFNFHQDNQYTRFDGPGINMWFALTPMTDNNGCLQVAPRSHLAGTLESRVLDDGHRSTVYEPDNFVSVHMQPGDCIAFSRLTVHGSGANTTSEARVAYAVQFNRDDVCATWDGQETPVALKNFARWPVGPVDSILPKEAIDEDLDGH